MLSNLNRFLLRSYRFHVFGFFACISLMMVVDFFLLKGWATFWIMIFWAMLFGIHFMIYRSQRVDEEWLEERMLFDVYRLWDYGHVAEIRKTPFGKSIYRTEEGKVSPQLGSNNPNARNTKTKLL